jgi:HEAT repeat protein
MAQDDPDPTRDVAAVERRLAQLVREDVPRLAAELKAAAPDVRSRAVEVFGALGDQALALLGALRGVLRDTAYWDEETGVRVEAVQTLIRLGPQLRSQLPALVESLNDEFASVRRSAAHDLGEMGAEAHPAAAYLQAALRDPDVGVRVEAAVALWRAERQGRPVVPVLAEALAEDDEILRWLAADCLGDIGPAAREAVPDLLAALRGEIRLALVRKSLELALERIDPEAAARARR